MAWTEFDSRSFGELYESLWGQLNEEQLDSFVYRLSDRPIASVLEAMRGVHGSQDVCRRPSPKAIAAACGARRPADERCAQCFGDPIRVRLWVLEEEDTVPIPIPEALRRRTRSGHWLVSPRIAREMSPPGDPIRWPMVIWLFCDHCRRWANITKRSVTEFHQDHREFYQPETRQTGRAIHRIVKGLRTPEPMIDYKQFIDEAREGSIEIDGRSLGLIQKAIGL